MKKNPDNVTVALTTEDIVATCVVGSQDIRTYSWAKYDVIVGLIDTPLR